MNADALRYLTPPLDDFWNWASDGEAILWQHGQVVAFRSELAQLLGPWKERGFPNLTDVLMVVAATRDNWPVTRVALPDTHGLDRVYQLPRDLRSSTDGRLAILATLFENVSWDVGPEVAAEVWHLLQHPSEEILTSHFSYRSDNRHPSSSRDRGWIEDRIQRLDPTRLQQRMATGVEGHVRPADVKLETSSDPSRVVRDLLVELREHPHWSGLATAAQQLIGVLSLPRLVGQREERPHGGVSDIANRGTLDRLLLSELAHDDLTLATRVAMNEAMYLRREQPPAATPQQRLLLLDCGIRQWGVPRLFATAVALALFVNKSAQTVVDLYQACGTQLHKVELAGLPSVLELLRLLRAETHVGQALPELEKIVKQFAGATEVVLITSPEGAEDFDFLQSLAAIQLPRLYLITVRRTGECQLWEMGNTGRQLLKSLTIDLRTISDSPPVDPARFLETAKVELPGILRLTHFPLRLSENIHYGRTWSTPEIIYAFTGDKRLLAWDSKSKGAIQVTDRFAGGEIACSFQTEGYDYAVVRSKKNAAGIQLVRVCPPGDFKAIPLQFPHPPESFFYHQGYLVAVLTDHVATVDLTHGHPLRTLPLHPYKQQHGRFFQRFDSKTWSAICPDGLQIRQESVAIPPKYHSQTILLFETAGIDGSIALLESGRAYLTAAEREIPVLPPGYRLLRCLEICSDSRTLLLQAEGGSSTGQQCFVANIAAGTCNPVFHASLLRSLANDRYEVRSKRNRFQAVQIDSIGCLGLVGKRDTLLEIRVQQQILKLHETTRSSNGPSTARSAQPVEFESYPSPPGVGYELSLAKWPDGSCAFLDSRGLLHLKSSNPALPETTLVLTDRSLAGWNSCGQLAGDEYYLGKKANVTMETFFKESVTRFVLEVMARC